MREVVISSISPGFPELSRSEGQITHVLLTRSPLVYPRRGLTARLACVKHAASVRPEPGSNSPLKNETIPTKQNTNKNNTTSSNKQPPQHTKRPPTTTDSKQNKKPNVDQKHTVEFSKINHTPQPNPQRARPRGGVLLYPITAPGSNPGSPLEHPPGRQTARLAAWRPEGRARSVASVGSPAYGLASPLFQRRMELYADAAAKSKPGRCGGDHMGADRRCSW